MRRNDMAVKNFNEILKKREADEKTKKSAEYGEAEIKRSDFGIDWGIPFGIGDEVDLKITVAFEKD